MSLIALVLAGSAPLAADPFGPDAPAPCAAVIEGVLESTIALPATGFRFVIPGEEADALEPLPPCAPEPVRPDDPNLFGFYALPVGNGPIAARWRQGDLLGVNGDDAAVLSLAHGLSTAGTGANPLALVNARVNAEVRYVDDAGGDAWAGAMDTLRRRQGDCEDLAILKLALLAKAGFAMDDLFLLVVRDTGRQIDHAVAVVRYENRTWILDNRIDAPQGAERVMDYVPLQAFSGRWAWTFGYKGGTRAGSVARTSLPQPGGLK